MFISPRLSSLERLLVRLSAEQAEEFHHIWEENRVDRHSHLTTTPLFSLSRNLFMANETGKTSSRRKALPVDVARVLLARSAGYCQNPSCNTELFRFFENGEVAGIQELAHIVGQSADGPRGTSGLSSTDRDSINNIILLCPSCHTLIDKSPNNFPIETLHQWKAGHEQRVTMLFSVKRHENRASLNQELAPLFRQNRSIFYEYGPTSDRESIVMADAAKMWKQQVLSKIIPNNRKISSILRQNQHLLSTAELDLAERFFLHQEGFEFNHISNDKNKDVPLFPSEILGAFATS